MIVASSSDGSGMVRLQGCLDRQHNLFFACRLLHSSSMKCLKRNVLALSEFTYADQVFDEMPDGDYD